jgi:hypothetical protein
MFAVRSNRQLLYEYAGIARGGNAAMTRCVSAAWVIGSFRGDRIAPVRFAVWAVRMAMTGSSR